MKRTLPARPHGKRQAIPVIPADEPAAEVVDIETVYAFATVSVERALEANELEHAGAILTVSCIICGAAAGVECTYGALGGERAGQDYPGHAHTRRVRQYLAIAFAKEAV